MPKRTGSAEWKGGLKDGRGSLSLGSGAFEGGYSFGSRFEEGKGTNPEELIGAAHAACFSMALSAGLGRSGTPPERLDVSAEVTFDKQDAGWKVASSHLTVRGVVPGISTADFVKAAEAARDGCPISGALKGNVELSVDASLAS